MVIAPPPVPNRVLVVLPSWVGDVVMATPMLRALRALYPQARITYLMKSYVRPVIEASPWHDRIMLVRPRPQHPDAENIRRRLKLRTRLRRRRFDLAILLPNSLRSALLTSAVGIARRLGYDRDGRGLLLTDRLLPMMDKGQYLPVSAVDYYLCLAGYLGADVRNRRVQLHTHSRDDARADALLHKAGIDFNANRMVLLNPGAATKGGAKLWPAERFAAVADTLIERFGVRVLVNGSPKERAILDAVHAAARHPLIDLQKAGSDLTLLKSILRRCCLAISNDTGARHIAAAIGTPLISLFGPTDPRWTRLEPGQEVIVRAADGITQSITLDHVLEQADRMLHTPEPYGSPTL